MNYYEKEHICTPETCPFGDAYYVSAIDDLKNHFLMAGPYSSHTEALSHLNEALKIADSKDGRAWFMSWGTLRLLDGTQPVGRLQKAGLMPVDPVAEKQIKEARFQKAIKLAEALCARTP